MSPDHVTLYPPTRVSLDNIQVDEVCIVGMLLMVWAGAIYVFFNQWGKIYGNYKA